MKKLLPEQIAQITSGVSCRMLLEKNGIRVNRSGFAVCPLHNDHDGSLKVYEGDRGWYCFGCHKGGSVIDLARQLYGTDFRDAVLRLNDEFSLGLDPGGETSAAERFRSACGAHQRKKELARERRDAERRWEECDYWAGLRQFCDRIVLENEDRSGNMSPLFAAALNMRCNADIQLREADERRLMYGGS